MENILFKNVTFIYPNSDKKALENINLSIAESEFVLVCGKSGCGKSTLLKHIKKSMTPFGELKGDIYYKGIELEKLDKRISASDIGFVQQNPENQIVTDKVYHELAFGLESLGVDRRTIGNRIAEISNFFGIQTWYRKNTSDLSGGQKQLLNLASIMAMQPKVIVLDEPTSQLDPIAAKEFLNMLSKINTELGITIIISEHRLEDVFPIADKIAVMENGKITAFDTQDNIAKFFTNREVKHPLFLGLPTPMKVFFEISGEGRCPITVREGKTWLDNLLDNKKIVVDNLLEEINDKISNENDNKSSEIVIQIKDAWFRYDKNSDDVIRGLNLKIKDGELYCILGGNGVGKTTTFKLISGSYKPYRGNIIVNGKNINKYSNKELFTNNVGILPQDPQILFTEITVEEELYEVFEDKNIKYSIVKEKVDNMLKLLELNDLTKSHPYDLSGGEQQRLGLGKVLLPEPKILLMDEPTKGLDPFFKDTFKDILKKLKNEGVTICMITHDIEFCAENADRCGMFFDGRVFTENDTIGFFGGNSFYTTTANRMSRHIFKNAITYKDVVNLCDMNIMN